jgi:hypothetical protein
VATSYLTVKACKAVLHGLSGLLPGLYWLYQQLLTSQGPLEPSPIAMTSAPSALLRILPLRNDSKIVVGSIVRIIVRSVAKGLYGFINNSKGGSKETP